MSTNKLLGNNLRIFIAKHRTWLYLGWVFFIGLLTLIPGRAIPNLIDWNFFSIDKIIHFSIFFVLTFLGAVNFYRSPGKYIGAIGLSITIAILYGALIEYIQIIIPDRGFDYADLTANILGAACGAFWFYYKKEALADRA